MAILAYNQLYLKFSQKGELVLNKENHPIFQDLTGSQNLVKQDKNGKLVLSD